MTTREIVTEYLRDIHALSYEALECPRMMRRILREERQSAESLTGCIEQSASLAVTG